MQTGLSSFFGGSKFVQSPIFGNSVLKIVIVLIIALGNDDRLRKNFQQFVSDLNDTFGYDGTFYDDIDKLKLIIKNHKDKVLKFLEENGIKLGNGYKEEPKFIINNSNEVHYGTIIPNSKPAEPKKSGIVTGDISGLKPNNEGKYNITIINNPTINICNEKNPIKDNDISISEKHLDIKKETRLRNTYNKLIELKWIDSKTRVEDFLWVFDKKSEEEKPKDFKRIRWTKISRNKRINKTSLIYLCRLVFDYSNKDINDKFFIWAEERFDFDIPMRANNKGFDNIPEEILEIY